jgi:hypothetical protein
VVHSLVAGAELDAAHGIEIDENTLFPRDTFSNYYYESVPSDGPPAARRHLTPGRKTRKHGRAGRSREGRSRESGQFDSAGGRNRGGLNGRIGGASGGSGGEQQQQRRHLLASDAESGDVTGQLMAVVMATGALGVYSPYLTDTAHGIQFYKKQQGRRRRALEQLATTGTSNRGEKFVLSKDQICF